MVSGTVLLTGATGFVGFSVLKQALKSGYQVKAAVRSVEKAKEKLLKTPSFASSDLGAKLTFVEVPDILASGAYNDAVKDVDYVIHVASPVPRPHMKDLQKELVDPAIAGTVGILESALPSKQIKRIVITSSFVGNVILDGTPMNAKLRTPDAKGPFNDLATAYRASKNLALNASEKFVKDNNPSWDLINIMPGFIIGPNELATTKLELLNGTAPDAILAYVYNPRPRLTGFAYIEDVSHVHVAALDSKIPGGRAYGVNQYVDWNTAWNIIERDYPEAIKEGIFTQKDAGNIPFKWDASETEEVFGFKFTTYEKAVIASVEQYLSVIGKK